MKTESNAKRNLIQALREKPNLLRVPFESKLSLVRQPVKPTTEPQDPLHRQMTHSKFGNLAGITQKKTLSNTNIKPSSKLSSRIYDSVLYSKFKQFQKIVYLLLEEPFSSPLSKIIFSIIMICVAASALEEVIVNSTSVPHKSHIIVIVDIVTSTIFVTELIFRLLSVSAFGESLGSYVFRPYFIIDFIAILPPFFEGFGDNTIAVRGVINSRVLGLFRIFRVFKTARYIKDATIFIEGVRKSLAHFGFLILLMVIANLTFATMIYYLESTNKESKLSAGIPSAMWWAMVTMSTVGYGDIVPITPQGKVVASMTAIFGNLMLTLPVVILGYNFQEVYAHKQEEKQVMKLKETAVAKTATVGMTADKKEISFMKQRIANIEVTNKQIMTALNNSESLYKKVSLDLKDLFRSMYNEIDDSPEENGTKFDRKIKLMERLAKAKRKIKLVHVFKRNLNDKRDSDNSNIKTDKEESPLKLKDPQALKNIFASKINEERSVTFGDSFGDNDENAPKIITIYHPLKKKLEKTHLPSEEFSSESDEDEANKLFSMPVRGSVLLKEKVRRQRLEIFKEDTRQSLKPLRTIIEKKLSPLGSSPSKQPSSTNLFCIKSHSTDNPNKFLKYRNERLQFLDNKILNQLLDDWGGLEDLAYEEEDNSSSCSRNNADDMPRPRHSMDIRKTKRHQTHIPTEIGYETLRKLLPSDDEGADISRRSRRAQTRKWSQK